MLILSTAWLIHKRSDCETIHKNSRSTGTVCNLYFCNSSCEAFFLQVTRCREVKTNEGLMCSNCGFGLWEINRWPSYRVKQIMFSHHLASHHTHTLTRTQPATAAKPHSKTEHTVIWFRDIRRWRDGGQNINGIVCTQRYGMWHITEPDRKLKNCLYLKMGCVWACVVLHATKTSKLYDKHAHKKCRCKHFD